VFAAKPPPGWTEAVEQARETFEQAKVFAANKRKVKAKRKVKTKRKAKRKVKRKAKRKVKRKRSKKPPEPKLEIKEPKGSTRRDQAQSMADFFTELLEYACRESPANCHVYPGIVERDLTVNGQLSYDTRGGRSAHGLIDELQLGSVWPPGDYWISVGVRYQSTSEQLSRAQSVNETRYLSWIGTREIFDYGRRVEDAGLAWNWLAHEVIPRLDEQGFAITSVHIRLHWNWRGTQPKYEVEKPWTEYAREESEDAESDEE
jgi:hypothetical protein